MLVSIITPSYNSILFISNAIESVLKQTYADWELIIVDDSSTDKSPDLIKKYAAKDPRIKYLRQPKNAGVAAARNAGLKHAAGVLVAFLDSDDAWDELKLEKQVHFMAHNNYDFTCCAYRKINKEGALVYPKVNVSKKITYKMLLKHNEIGCLTAMYNVEKVGKHYFPEVGHEDYATWLKILKTGQNCYGLDMVLASYRVHSNTVSSNKFKAATYTWHILRSEEKFSKLKSMYYFTNYMFNSFIKYLKR
jgi:teichuronic acid biosynthesis glycosyltransferase TuaG